MPPKKHDAKSSKKQSDGREPSPVSTFSTPVLAPTSPVYPQKPAATDTDSFGSFCLDNAPFFGVEVTSEPCPAKPPRLQPAPPEAPAAAFAFGNPYGNPAANPLKFDSGSPTSPPSTTLTSSSTPTSPDKRLIDALFEHEDMTAIAELTAIAAHTTQQCSVQPEKLSTCPERCKDSDRVELTLAFATTKTRNGSSDPAVTP